MRDISDKQRDETLALTTGMLLKGLPKEEQENILRDMAILARVKSAASRGNVIIELDKGLFERMAQDAVGPTYSAFVEWKEDDMGFMAPTVLKVSPDPHIV